MKRHDVVSTLQHLVSGIDENIVIFDQGGVILHASQGLRDMLDFQALEGTRIFEHIEEKMPLVEQWLQHLSGSHFKDVNVKMFRGTQAFPARIRMAAWSVGRDEFIVLASMADSTFIERKKRDLLRKTLTIEQLSRSRKIRNGKLNDAIYEILELCSKAVKVERVNAWLLDETGSALECIGNFDAKANRLVPQDSLPRIDMPGYFALFEKEKIILTTDSRKSEITRELVESYLVPNDIHAMMDIPLRVEGTIIGVICFEQTKQAREWTLHDQKFGLIAAQMVSLSVETYKRKRAQQQLESTLNQQRRLMSEMSSRVKNNLAIATDFVRMQADRCKDEYHRDLMMNTVNRINSVTALYELLSTSEPTGRIQFKSYAKQLLERLQSSLSDPARPIQLIESVESCELSGALAVTLGLIINEAVTNAYKHAFEGQNSGCVHVELVLDGPKGTLSVFDTGNGFPKDVLTPGNGLDIIAGLAHHIEGYLSTDSVAGSKVSVGFRLR